MRYSLASWTFKEAESCYSASLFLETPLTATASDAKTKRPEHLRTKEDQMPPRKLSKKQKKAVRP